MVGNNASTNKTHKLYNSTVQDISRGGGYCATKVGALCACFVDIVSPVKTQVGNDIDRILNFQGQNIYVSDQSIFINIYGPSYQRRKKPILATHSQQPRAGQAILCPL